MDSKSTAILPLGVVASRWEGNLDTFVLSPPSLPSSFLSAPPGLLSFATSEWISRQPDLPGEAHVCVCVCVLFLCVCVCVSEAMIDSLAGFGQLVMIREREDKKTTREECVRER